MTATVLVFQNESEYCAFLKVLSATGYVRHHSAKAPRYRYGRRKGYKGYAEKYEGRFGNGWRIVIHTPQTVSYNDRAIYYVKENENG